LHGKIFQNLFSQEAKHESGAQQSPNPGKTTADHGDYSNIRHEELNEPEQPGGQ
jgi:hypothetical protein